MPNQADQSEQRVLGKRPNPDNQTNSQAAKRAKKSMLKSEETLDVETPKTRKALFVKNGSSIHQAKS